MTSRADNAPSEINNMSMQNAQIAPAKHKNRKKVKKSKKKMHKNENFEENLLEDILACVEAQQLQNFM